MKWSKWWMVFGLLLAFAAGGCSTLDQLYDQQVAEAPGPVVATNVVYKTNIVTVQAASTNVLTGEIVPARVRHEITPEIEIVRGPPVWVTNLIARPMVQGTIQGAAAVPVPFAGAAALLLGWAYSAYGHFRSRRLAQGLVVSIQAGRRLLNETPEGKILGAQFKAKLQQSQAMQGIAPWVKKLLDATLPDHKV